MTRPAIGVCAAIEQARWGPWDETAVLLPLSYIEAIHDAGGLPLLLPVHDLEAGSAAQILDGIDALVLAGGVDLDPASYGADRHAATVRTRPERDRFERELAATALDRDIPILGICRGMQMLNVTTGGTLVQHLPDRVGHDRHQPVSGEFAEHEVRLEPESLAAVAAGAERLTIKTHHHQGVDALGDGMVASGWDESGTIEAIELPDRGFVLGVLWHPEQDPGNRVISALVDSAERAGGR